MITVDMIPDEVVEAMSEADYGTTTYAELLAAALNAWPRARTANNGSSICLDPHLILPLETRAAGVSTPQKEPRT